MITVAEGLFQTWEMYNKEEGETPTTATPFEGGARLCLHLLLKLFKAVDTMQPLFYSLGSPQPMPRPSTHASGIKYSCDRHLLFSAHRFIFT